MTSIASMTGFARVTGTESGTDWTWELRSVNGRGLDLRLKLPSGLDSLEPRLRAILTARCARGTVQATLTLRRDEANVVAVDRALLARLIDEARAALPDAPPPRIEALMGLPGVIRREAQEEAWQQTSLIAAISAGFETACDALVAARQAEGGRLAAVLAGLLARIRDLHGEARAAAELQPEAQQMRLTESLRRLLGDQAGLPPERLAQEVALLATRSDVTEELDRLASHIDAAGGLLSLGEPVGRQLDFLVQEFMREANTLCSKSASNDLTSVGLGLKAVVDQLREQVQNIE